MRVLLLNPPGPFLRAGSRWPHKRKASGVGIDYHPFPFSLAYAASRLAADGHEVRLLDCIATGMDGAALMRDVAEFRPELAVMETSAPSFPEDTETVSRLGVPAIAVGAHPTATPRDHLDAGFAAVLLGEYDQAVAEALDLAPRPWLALPDASWDPGARAPLARDLDAVPWPAWDQLPMEKYNDPFCRGRSVTVLSSRGCPNRCSFCTIAPHTGGAHYRTRTAANVCDEVEALVARYQPDEVYFDDDTIDANEAHLAELCDELTRRGFGLPFSCMGTGAVPRELLEKMRGAGCRAYKFGVETGDPEVMRRIPKALDLAAVRRTVQDCRDLGIQAHATFLLGLPGENRERALRTIDFALSLDTHTLQFAIATPYPGTRFYERAREKGWLTKESWHDFDPAGEAVVSYPDYPADEIVAMHELAWKRWQAHMLRHRPATVLHHFRNALRREGLPGVLRLGCYSVSRLAAVLGTRP